MAHADERWVDAAVIYRMLLSRIEHFSVEHAILSLDFVIDFKGRHASFPIPRPRTMAKFHWI